MLRLWLSVQVRMVCPPVQEPFPHASKIPYHANWLERSTTLAWQRVALAAERGTGAFDLRCHRMQTKHGRRSVAPIVTLVFAQF